MGRHLYDRCLNSLVDRNYKAWEQAGGLPLMPNHDSEPTFSTYNPELTQYLGGTRSEVATTLGEIANSETEQNMAPTTETEVLNPLDEELKTLNSSLTMENIIAQKIAQYQRTLSAKKK